jgi:hypothetical protein
MLTQQSIIKINRIRRKLLAIKNKLNRLEISNHIKHNHKNKINDINITLTTLELQILDLQHTINIYLNANRSISSDSLNEINSTNLTNRTIKEFLPYMMVYMMINDTNSILNTPNFNNNNDLDTLD